MNIKTVTLSILILLLGCSTYVDEAVIWGVDESLVSEIILSEFKEGKFIREVVLKDKIKMKSLILYMENNYQHPAKFLPEYEATIKFGGGNDSIDIMFRGDFFKVSGKGSFRMRTSIDKIIKDLNLFDK